MIGRQFRDHGRLVVYSSGSPYICFGVLFESGAELSLWVEFYPGDRGSFTRFCGLAKSAKLREHQWVIRDSRWPSISRVIPLAGDMTHASIRQWLRARLHELETAKIVDELVRAGQGASAS